MADAKRPTQIADISEHGRWTTVKLGNYILGTKLGTGSFGSVLLCKQEFTEQEVAIKVLNRAKMKSLNTVKNVKKEILNLYKFRHPHIIQLYDVLSNPTYIFLVMEYAPRGDLYNYITKKKVFRRYEARRLFQQIIFGVDFCHSQMVVHRDLKPENILLDENMNVKIADFGLSNLMVDGEFLDASCGTLNYIAPELLLHKLYVGPEIDVWSCGVILFVLLCSRLPFSGVKRDALRKKIISGVFSIPYFIDEDLGNFLRHMLQTNPVKRATLDDIKKHAWFQKDLHKAQYVSGDPNDQFTEMNNKQRTDEYRINTAKKLSDIESSKECDNSSHASKGDQCIQSDNCVTKQTAKTTTWKLGLRTSHKPAQIMLKVFTALEALNYDWRVLDPFHLIVRKYNKFTGKYAKISLQVYKTSSDDYLVDCKSGVESKVNFCNIGTIGQPRQVFTANVNQTGSQTMEFLDMCLTLKNKLNISEHDFC